MANLDSLKKYKSIYMIGIGGVSMSGLAELLTHHGFKVSGSDAKESDNTRHLKELGIQVFIGHQPKNLLAADLIVYTAAIPDDDPEKSYGLSHNLPMMERSEFLGLITSCYQKCICISGTHGKTTTTSMVSMCFLESNLDPTIEVGANLTAIKGNNRTGNSEYFILEACEYVDSFLKFFPHSEIILNIDADHLDYFKNLENIKHSFHQFAQKLDETGCLVINKDDKNSLEILNNINTNIRTYGIESKSDWTAKNIKLDTYGYPTFDVYHQNLYYTTIKLNVLGRHNILNALATIALCDFYQLKKEDIKKGLEKFTGASRRFEKIGTYKNIPVIDDYAHHPTEIKTTLASSKELPHHETWAIFEPHTYSRTVAHFDEFVDVLKEFDHIILADIYAAREKNTTNISSKDLIKEIGKSNPNSYYFDTYDKIIEFLKENVQEHDLIITIGAGTINQVGYKLVEKNKISI